MSTAEHPTTDELLEMMQGDPDDVLAEHTDLLEEMRDEAESDALAAYIDATLERLNDGDVA